MQITGLVVVVWRGKKRRNEKARIWIATVTAPFWGSVPLSSAYDKLQLQVLYPVVRWPASEKISTSFSISAILGMVCVGCFNLLRVSAALSWRYLLSGTQWTQPGVHRASPRRASLFRHVLDYDVRTPPIQLPYSLTAPLVPCLFLAMLTSSL